MLDRTSPIPLCDQLEEIIRQQISKEKWLPGEAITSENALSKEYGLSRMTVRAVITKLVQEGLLYRVAGKGTFVAEPKVIATPLPYNGIREQLETQGYKISTIVIRNEKIRLPERIASKLGISFNENVYYIERVRYMDDKPFSFHCSYLKTSFEKPIPMDRLEKEQLCKILEHDYKIVPTKVEETLELVHPTDRQAEILEIKNSEPLLLLSDKIYVGNEIEEYSEVYFRGDKIKLYFEFNELSSRGTLIK